MPRAMVYFLFLLVIISAIYITANTILLWISAGMIYKFIAGNIFCYISLQLLNKEIAAFLATKKKEEPTK